jgi:ubiquinone/menaquinone biosynthesis C-methylase UbiE
MNTQHTYQDHIRHYQLDGEFYDFFSPDKFMKQEIRRRYQEFFHLASIKKNDSILEIGSGGGFALELLKGIKPAYFPLDIPRKNLKKIKNSASFTVFPSSADAYHLPFRDKVFDVIIMSEVVEHLAQPLEVLYEVYRTMKKNGTLIISVPYKEKITYQICIHCNRPTPTHAHLHSFDQYKLAHLVSDTGFIPFRFSKNCNKIPNRLHLNLFLKSVPFRLWKLMDKTFNLFFDKPTSLILISYKK